MMRVRSRIRSVRNRLYGLALGFVVAASVGVFGAAALDRATSARRHVVVGPVSIDVPGDWILRDGPAADNPHYDAPGPSRGLGPSVAIAIQDAQPQSPDDPGVMKTLSRERRTIAGHAATVRQWRYEEEDSQGVTVLIDGVIPGKSVMVTGWTPRPDWPRRGPEILTILDTIAISGASAATAARPTGPISKAELGNIDAVLNGPRKATIIRIERAIFVRSLRTYHWNDARGAAPGSISLVDASGRTLGAWRARGEPGQGGVPNAYWVARVDQRIEPGAYVLTTSNNKTWATNAGTGWRGFYTIEYQAMEQAPVASPPPATDDPAIAFRAAQEKLALFSRTQDLGAWNAAMEAARKAVAGNPRSAVYWRLLGRAYALAPADQALDPKLAVDAYEKAVALDPGNASARMKLASLLIARKAYAPALEQIEAALVARPELATAAVVQDLTRLYGKADRIDRGIDYFAKFFARHPDARTTELGQAILMNESGRTAEALLLARKIANDPNTPAGDAAQARALLNAWL